jgi:hypothetical protein
MNNKIELIFLYVILTILFLVGVAHLEVFRTWLLTPLKDAKLGDLLGIGFILILVIQLNGLLNKK